MNRRITSEFLFPRILLQTWSIFHNKRFNFPDIFPFYPTRVALYNKSSPPSTLSSSAVLVYFLFYLPLSLFIIFVASLTLSYFKMSNSELSGGCRENLKSGKCSSFDGIFDIFHNAPGDDPAVWKSSRHEWLICSCLIIVSLIVGSLHSECI
jgi:hypothetical protein